MSQTKDKASCGCFNIAAVEYVKGNLLAGEEVELLAETFKVLSDQTRISILDALAQNELCVHDLSYVIDKSVSAVSHQLRLLRNARLVKSRRQGKNIFYSLDDDHVVTLWQQTLEHIRHN